METPSLRDAISQGAQIAADGKTLGAVLYEGLLLLVTAETLGQMARDRWDFLHTWSPAPGNRGTAHKLVNRSAAAATQVGVERWQLKTQEDVPSDRLVLKAASHLIVFGDALLLEFLRTKPAETAAKPAEATAKATAKVAAKPAEAKGKVVAKPAEAKGKAAVKNHPGSAFETRRVPTELHNATRSGLSIENSGRQKTHAEKSRPSGGAKIQAAPGKERSSDSQEEEDSQAETSGEDDAQGAEEDSKGNDDSDDDAWKPAQGQCNAQAAPQTAPALSFATFAVTPSSQPAQPAQPAQSPAPQTGRPANLAPGSGEEGQPGPLRRTTPRKRAQPESPAPLREMSAGSAPSKTPARRERTSGKAEIGEVVELCAPAAGVKIEAHRKE